MLHYKSSVLVDRTRTRTRTSNSNSNSRNNSEIKGSSNKTRGSTCNRTLDKSSVCC
jgi:hypothetical protein